MLVQNGSRVFPTAVKLIVYFLKRLQQFFGCFAFHLSIPSIAALRHCAGRANLPSPVKTSLLRLRHWQRRSGARLRRWF